MNFSLQNKYAIVCGSSGGIGLAVAKELADLGATCCLLARNEDALKNAIEALPTPFQQAHDYRVIDLGNTVELKKMAADITATQAVHILINNSGGPASGPILNATDEQFVHAFQQHIIASHVLTTAVISGMKSEGFGRIVNIISTSVKIPLHNLGVSNTIRGSMASWAKTMANELGQFGITVNNVLPGFTRTGRLHSLIEATAKREELPVETVAKNMTAEVPAKRFGEAAEVAAMAAFLCTPAAAYVNGTSIPVDGGRTGSI